MRRRYPPQNESAADLPISRPCIIVDMQGIILAWYLPGILKDSRQVCTHSLLQSPYQICTSERNDDSNGKVAFITWQGQASSVYLMARQCWNLSSRSQGSPGCTKPITGLVPTRSWGMLFQCVISLLAADFFNGGGEAPSSCCSVQRSRGLRMARRNFSIKLNIEHDPGCHTFRTSQCRSGDLQPADTIC